MEREEKEEEKAEGEKRKKPYQKPAFTEEELFEAAVLACNKRLVTGCNWPNVWRT
jgi:hypothetical protein